MAINPNQVTVGDLFGSKKYFVDFYQREYKWNDNIKNQSYKPIKAFEVIVVQTALILMK